MQNYKRYFIDFLIKHKALSFGQFRLKSGRISPYFFNAGQFQSGASLAKLGEFYATALIQSELAYDTLYGPAYKGIPLVTATAIALHHQQQNDVPYCFNRKEVKDHGDGGLMVGAPLTGRIVMIDDVITAGTTINDTITIFQQYQTKLAGIIIAFDRQERGQNQQSAVQQFSQQLGIAIHSIITLHDVITYLHQDEKLKTWLQPIEQYQAQYGVLH